MTIKEKMNSIKKTARVAGLLYLLVVVFPLIGGIIRVSLITGDAATTANNVVASEGLFRIGIVTDILHMICLLLLLAWVFIRVIQTSKQKPCFTFHAMHFGQCHYTVHQYAQLFCGLARFERG